MTNRIQILLLVVMSLIFVACKSNPNGVEVTGGSKDGSEGGFGDQKPTGSPTPFAVDQFKKGQWIIWRRKAHLNQEECVRWQWATVGTSVNVHKILGDYSPNCKNWPEDRIRVIKYFPKTGKIESDYFSKEEGPAKNPDALETIYDHLYGSEEKVNFVVNPEFAFGPEWKLPVFTVEKKKNVYFNKPGHPFHGIVLKWSEKEEGLLWNYEVLGFSPEDGNQ